MLYLWFCFLSLHTLHIMLAIVAVLNTHLCKKVQWFLGIIVFFIIKCHSVICNIWWLFFTMTLHRDLIMEPNLFLFWSYYCKMFVDMAKYKFVAIGLLFLQSNKSSINVIKVKIIQNPQSHQCSCKTIRIGWDTGRIESHTSPVFWMAAESVAWAHDSS